MTNKVKMVTIDRNSASQRIDNFLITALKGVPKSRIYRMVRKGEVRVNKKRIQVSYRLCLGDEVRIPPVEVRAPVTLTPTDAMMTKLSGCILYEDENLLIINKPYGMPVHGGTGIAYGLIDILRANYPWDHLSLVHRLDRDTSGCLMVAKNRAALLWLHDALKAGKMIKTYTALTQGQWKPDQLWVDLPLAKDYLQSGERMVVLDESGKEAMTRFEILQDFQLATLVKAILMTGRTHQIRVHTQAMGHPIAGDDKYGDKNFNQQMKNWGLRRLFLHAQSITLPLPMTGTLKTVSAPLENQLGTVLDALSAHYI